MPIAKEGWPFIFAGLALTFFMMLLHQTWAAAGAALVTAFVVWFFRDPERSVPQDDSLLVSPADGTVVETMPLPDGGSKVGIFLSIFNVHVNRVPASGEVLEVDHRNGRFLAAWNTIASDENERTSVSIRCARGEVKFVQVAGLIARRIICRIKEGDTVERGQRYGLIRFGSRVDIYLPANTAVEVTVGDKVCGGTDVIARWIE